MQATARMASVVSATSCARRRLIRNVRPTYSVMPDITVSDIAQASTPGNIRISRIQWLRCYPGWPLIWLTSLVISLVLTVSHSPLWLILALPLLIMNWLYWVRVREHFGSGDVCPAVVISVSPLVLAVGTDMTTGGDPRPAVKVLRVPVASLTKEQRQIGARIATVALYYGDHKADAWEGFDPRPVGSVTTDARIIDAVCARIPEELWSDFYHWKSHVPKLRLGLHRVVG
jgi:hypothetical protein